MRAHAESRFPKVCSNCNRRFATLREYLQVTTHVGPAISYDAETGDWNPRKPLGIFSYANCPCGNTLSLSSAGLPLPMLWLMMNWARTETQRRGLTPQQLLNYLRDEICKQVLTGRD